MLNSRLDSSDPFFQWSGRTERRRATHSLRTPWWLMVPEVHLTSRYIIISLIHKDLRWIPTRTSYQRCLKMIRLLLISTNILQLRTWRKGDSRDPGGAVCLNDSSRCWKINGSWKIARMHISWKILKCRDWGMFLISFSSRLESASFWLWLLLYSIRHLQGKKIRFTLLNMIIYKFL